MAGGGGGCQAEACLQENPEQVFKRDLDALRLDSLGELITGLGNPKP